MSAGVGVPRTVLVTGAAGLVGSWVLRSAPPGCRAVGTVRADTELADSRAVARLFARVQPDLVVHTAFSFANLERDVVAASGCVAEACASSGVGLIHLSTDSVFSGRSGPYTEDAVPDPVNAYGRAKLAAEADLAARLPGAAIVRTSLVCWDQPADPRTEWVLRSLREGTPISLFQDEVRCPIRADDLSAALWELAAMGTAERAGVWHVAGAEPMNRVELGVLIARHAGLDPGVITESRSADFPGPEPRPTDVRLASTRRPPLHTVVRSVRTLFPPRA